MPLLSVTWRMSLTVRSSTRGTPRPVSSSTTVILKYLTPVGSAAGDARNEPQRHREHREEKTRRSRKNDRGLPFFRIWFLLLILFPAFSVPLWFILFQRR